MSLFHQKKLQSIEEKIRLLQEEKTKTEQLIAASLMKALKNKGALSLDMNILIGGLFSVIDKINSHHPDCDPWQKTGQTFFAKQGKGASKTVAISKEIDPQS